MRTLSWRPATGPVASIAVDEAKLKFLFDTTPGDEVDITDLETREHLIDEEFSREQLSEDQVRLIRVVRGIIVNQIVGDDPPAVWKTVERLAGEGVDRSGIWIMLQYAMGRTLRETFDAGKYDDELYVDLLDQLPVPPLDVIKDAYRAEVRLHQPIPEDELDRKVAERLGLDAESEVVEDLLDDASDDLFEPNGSFCCLDGDRVIEIESFTAGITLTHRLNDVELQLGLINIAFDLAPFGLHDELRLSGTEERIETFSADEGHLAWHGPDGWLAALSPGDLIAIRLEDHSLSIERVATEPLVLEDMVGRARAAYERQLGELEMPVTGLELALGMLADDRNAFAAPRPPLDELCAAAGLERRQDRVAGNPSIWDNHQRMRRIHRLALTLRDPEQALAAARTCVTFFDDDALPADDVRSALTDLRDGEVLDAVVSELLADDDDDDDDGQVSVQTRDVVARCIDVARKPAHVAVARLLAARLEEADDDVLAAEAQLHLAAEADPDWAPALERLAWYLSDRGDAQGAARLWRRAGVVPGERQGQDLAEVEQFTHMTSPDLGRNDPCWCGSGRKFKHCHSGQPAHAPLPDRVGWLCRKAISYLEHSMNDVHDLVAEMVRHRSTDPEDDGSIIEALSDPLVLDVVLHERGWFGRFLSERGVLLPDDEAMLAESWMLVDRTVYEITDVRRGRSVTVRDIRTGDREEVREHTFSHQARPGMFVCARAVPDGESHQFVGAMFPVAPGTETHVLDLLDNEGPEELLAYVASTHRMPQMVTRENEPMVMCNVVIEAPDADAATLFLDAAYERKDAGAGWVELFDLNEDEAIVRSNITLNRKMIHIDSTSEPRVERTTAAILDGIDGARLVSDDRQPFDPKRDGANLARAAGALNNAPADPAAVAQIQEMMERRWLDEHIPALGGLTPRDAAADPTRRDELRRLIDSFDIPFDGSGGFGMRPSKLRHALGLR